VDVVVIGAGLSGLTAAALLRQAGASVQIVEADRLIGGRIRAVRDPVSNRALADLGPTWVWPKYQPVAARWLDRLGIATFEQFNNGDAVITGYGPAPLRQPVPGQDGMVRIAGGPSAFIDALAGIVGTARIRTSAAVTGISEDGPTKLQIHLGSGEILTAGKVIVAIPLRVAAVSLRLPWAPVSLLDALSGTPTWMSSQAKAVALYERPFWRDAGLSGRIVSRNGPLFEAHDHCSADNTTAAIFGFVSWSPEHRKKLQLFQIRKQVQRFRIGERFLVLDRAAVDHIAHGKLGSCRTWCAECRYRDDPAGTWRGEAPVRILARILLQVVVERDAVGQADEQHDADVVVPVLADADRLQHLVHLLDLGIDLGGADAHAAGVERGIGTAVDDMPPWGVHSAKSPWVQTLSAKREK
jgi:monoamine oxidase